MPRDSPEPREARQDSREGNRPGEDVGAERLALKECVAEDAERQRSEDQSDAEPRPGAHGASGRPRTPPWWRPRIVVLLGHRRAPLFRRDLLDHLREVPLVAFWIARRVAAVPVGLIGRLFENLRTARLRALVVRVDVLAELHVDPDRLLAELLRIAVLRSWVAQEDLTV